MLKKIILSPAAQFAGLGFVVLGASSAIGSLLDGETRRVLGAALIFLGTAMIWIDTPPRVRAHREGLRQAGTMILWSLPPWPRISSDAMRTISSSRRGPASR